MDYYGYIYNTQSVTIWIHSIRIDQINNLWGYSSWIQDFSSCPCGKIWSPGLFSYFMPTDIRIQIVFKTIVKTNAIYHYFIEDPIHSKDMDKLATRFCIQVSAARKNIRYISTNVWHMSLDCLALHMGVIYFMYMDISISIYSVLVSKFPIKRFDYITPII